MKDIFRLVRHGGFLCVVVFALFAMTNPLYAQWMQINLPGGYGYVRTFAVSGTNLFAGNDGGGGIFLSTDNGTSWTAVNSGLSSAYVYSSSAGRSGTGGTEVFAGTSGDVSLSTNNGISWSNTGLASGAVWCLAVSPNGAGGTNLFAGVFQGGVYLSTNNGTSWTVRDSGLTTLDVRSLAVSGTSLFAGTLGGGIFRSTNNGTSWTSANSGLTNTDVLSLAVIPNGVGGTSVFAGTFGGRVFRSTNNGTSWTAVSNGMTYFLVYSLAVSGTNVFAGTNGGVFLSTNNGTSWTAVDNGLTNTAVVSLAVSGTNLFAGSDSNRVWRRPLSEMITSVPAEGGVTDLPTHFSLEQNYPNPFNPATTISFSLPSPSVVSLTVFDALGREESILISKELSAGRYLQQWNAGGLASGIYFYRLQAGSFMETKKLILLR